MKINHKLLYCFVQDAFLFGPANLNATPGVIIVLNENTEKTFRRKESYNLQDKNLKKIKIKRPACQLCSIITITGLAWSDILVSWQLNSPRNGRMKRKIPDAKITLL